MRSVTCDERGVDALGVLRRQPQRRLVEQQQPRLRDERATDRDHLLLTTRQRPTIALLQHRNGGNRSYTSSIENPSRAPRARSRAHLQVLVHVRATGTRADPRAHGSTPAAPSCSMFGFLQSTPSNTTEPWYPTSPEIARNVEVFPAPFGPIIATTSPMFTSTLICARPAPARTRRRAHESPTRPTRLPSRHSSMSATPR